MTRQPFALLGFHPTLSSKGSGHLNPVYHNNTASHMLKVMRLSGWGGWTHKGKENCRGRPQPPEGCKRTLVSFLRTRELATRAENLSFTGLGNRLPPKDSGDKDPTGPALKNTRDKVHGGEMSFFPRT